MLKWYRNIVFLIFSDSENGLASMFCCCGLNCRCALALQAQIGDYSRNMGPGGPKLSILQSNMVCRENVPLFFTIFGARKMD